MPSNDTNDPRWGRLRVAPEEDLKYYDRLPKIFQQLIDAAELKVAAANVYRLLEADPQQFRRGVEELSQVVHPIDLQAIREGRYGDPKPRTAADRRMERRVRRVLSGSRSHGRLVSRTVAGNLHDSGESVDGTGADGDG